MPTILDTLSIQTCVVSYGKEASFAGSLANVAIQVTAKALGVNQLRLVWAATGDIFSSFTDSTVGGNGTPGIIVLPQTGQDGFRHGTTTFKDWYYEAAVTATTNDGQQLSRTYRFQIPAGQTTLDLDMLDEDGIVTAMPAIAPIAAEPAGLSAATQASLSATYLPLPADGTTAGSVPTVQANGSVSYSPPAAATATVITAINGEAAATTTARLNAALAAGSSFGVRKTVKLLGDFTTNAPLLHPSNTTIDASDATITLTSGSNCNIIKNSGSIPTVTGTATTTAASTTITTSVALTAGQYVTIAGADSAGTTVHTATVVSYNSGAGTAVISVAAKKTAAGAAMKVYRGNVNVRLTGGTWVTGANTATGSDLHAVYYRHVNNLTIDIPNLTTGGGKYAVSLGSIVNLWARVRGLNAYSDGVHLIGPISNARIEEVNGTSGDDLMPITANDWDPYSDTSGDVVGVSIGTVLGTSTNASLFKVVAGAGLLVDGIQVGLIAGTATLNGAWVGSDVSHASTTGGTYGAIDCGTIAATVAADGLHIYGCNAESIKARLALKQATAMTNGVELSGPSTGVAIKRLEISGSMAAPAATGSFITVTSGVPRVNHLIVDQVNYTPTTGANFPLVNLTAGQTGQIDVLTIRDAYCNFSANTSDVVYYGGGTLSQLRVSGGYFNGVRSILYRDTAATTTANLVAQIGQNANLRTSTQIARLLSGTNWLDLDGLHLVTVTSAVTGQVYAGGATVYLDGRLMSEVAYTLLQRAGTETVYCASPQLPVDLSLLTQRAGDLANNTQAGLTCGVGPAVSNGTLWKGLYSGTTSDGTIPPYAGDTFTRADSSTLGSTETGAYTWNVRSVTASIASNQLTFTATTASTTNGVTINDGQANGTVSAKMVTASQQGIYVRATDATMATGYVWNINSSGFYAFAKRTSDTTATGLYTSAITAVAGDVIAVAMNGSTFTLKVNGTTVQTVVDATYTGTFHGLYGSYNGTKPMSFDTYRHDVATS